jgi:hypothetical protein
MFGRNSATGNAPLRVLYDGWPIAACPGSPPALHLLEILESLPPGVEPWLALPSQPPLLPSLPNVQMALRGLPTEGPGDRLRWEQVHLPILARRIGADLLHTTTMRPPLFAAVPCLVSPAEYFPRDFSNPGGAASRLARALGSGGLSQSAGLLWPADLPMPDAPSGVPVFPLPPRAHSLFSQPQRRLPDLPDLYFYAPAPQSEEDCFILSETWQQVTAALGEDCALLVSDYAGSFFPYLRVLLPHPQILSLPSPSPERLASAVQHCAAVLQVSPVLPWADGLLHALACARPLVSIESVTSDRRIGPAGYLTPPDSARLLASAALTIALEEPVAEQLSQAAQSRASAWGSGRYSQDLLSAYNRACKG